MSEETKILEIKVEHQEAIKKIGEYKSKIDEIRAAEKRYKDEVKDGTMTQQEYNERITAAKVKTNEYKAAISVLEKQVTSQIKAQKSNADIMEEVNGLLGVNARSIVEAEAANKALREAVRNLNDEEESAYALRQQLNAQIEDNTDFIRRNSDAYIQQKMNIGNYTESIKQAFYEIKNGGLTMNTVGIVAQGFAQTLNAKLARGFSDVAHAGTRMAGAVRLVGAALAATGIGLVVAALAALAAAFTRTQKGMEFFQVTTAKVGSIIDVLLDRIALTVDAFKDLMKLDLSGFATKMKNAFAGIGEEMKKEWTLAGQLKEALIGIEKEETMLEMKRAANRAEIEKLKMVSDNVTKSTKERQEAAKKAFEMEQNLMNEEVALQEKRIANQLGFVEVSDEVRQTMKDIATGAMSADEAISKLGISSSTIDDLNQFSQDVVELYGKQESSTTRQIELQNKLNSISKEGREKEVTLTEKELQAIRDMEDALTAIIKIEQERTKVEVETKYDEEIAALRKRLAEEVSLNEEAQSKILATIEATEQKKRELMNSFGVDMSAYEEQRRALAKVYDDDIRQLSERLQEEVDLTDEARKEILAIIEEKEKAKAVLMVSVNADDKAFEKQKEMVISGYDEEIQALRKKLSEEKSLTEEAKNEILSIIETKEAAKRALSVDTSDNSEYFTKQIELIAKAYDNEIELLRNKLATEKDLTEKAQSDILSIIEAKEAEKREAVARVSIMDADLEEERQRTILAYDREIEDLKKRLETEKDLTEKARDAIIETIRAKEIQKENELDKLNDEAIAREIERQQKLIETQLEGVKEGTEAEHNLRVAALEKQREAELANKELTEQMKLAIVQKYEKLMNDEAVRYSEATAKAQSDAIKQQFDTAIAKAYGNELEISRLKMEQKKAELDAIQQMEGESLEAFNLRKLEAENEYLDAKQELRDKEVEIEQSKLQAMSDVTGGLISLMEAIGEENKAMAVASKVLALAQIAIDTGRAISAGVAEAVKIGFPQNIAAIATTVATVLANIATAIKTVKSAKFATGGDVIGAGTGTSDSVPAMLSNGESVLTAKATSMFAPILSAFNQAGGGVPINGQQTGNQAMGEEMLARAFAKGVANMPNPIVSVEEISTVTNRVKVIENINRI